MNKKLIGILSTLALLNIACSPQDNSSANPITSEAATTSNLAASSAATASTTETSTNPEAGSPEADSPEAGNPETTNPSASEFLNTYWKLILLRDTEIIADEQQTEPHIIFNAENRISGSDGCNRMMGTYTLDGSKLSLSQIATTMMACMKGNEQAEAFKSALGNVATVSIHADQLELRDETGLVLARFSAVAQP